MSKSSELQQQQQLDLVAFEQTPTSKRVTTIENRLTRELNSVVSKIRTHINPLQPANEIENRFKPLYEQQVYSAIREAATESYNAGVQYIADLPIFKNLHSYLIAEDIDSITRLTDEYTARFWGRIAITLTKGKDKIFGTIPITREEGLTEPKATFLSQRYIVEVISVGVTNTALNVATINKIRYYADKAHISPLNITPTRRSIAQFAFEDELLKRAEESGQSINTLTGLTTLEGLLSTVANVELMYLTSVDERVCPTCRPTHGTKWSLYDPAIVIPPRHHRCRCRLIVITK